MENEKIRLMALSELDKFVPVMSPGELREFALVLTGVRCCEFSEEQLASWTAALNAKNAAIQSRFDVALRSAVKPQK